MEVVPQIEKCYWCGREPEGFELLTEGLCKLCLESTAAGRVVKQRIKDCYDAFCNLLSVVPRD